MAETRHIEDCWCHITDDAIVELELSIEEMTIELEREDEMDYYFHRRGVFGQLTGRAA